MSRRRVAVHQPNFAPWCGYFAKMAHSDAFVFLDDVQMPGGQSYVYRTLVRKNQDASTWLSIPKHAALGTPINKVTFSDPRWKRKQLASLRGYYSKAPCFPEVMGLLEALYDIETDFLSDFNINVIRGIASFLGIRPEFFVSSRMTVAGGGDDRLIELTRSLGGLCYVSGKGGMGYQDPEKFKAAGIDLEVRIYHPIAYQQQYPRFMPGLSVLDALFNVGREAASLLRYY